MLGSNFTHGPSSTKRKLLGANLFAAGAADVAMRADPGLHVIFFARSDSR